MTYSAFSAYSADRFSGNPNRKMYYFRYQPLKRTKGNILAIGAVDIGAAAENDLGRH
jgi:hypothetical protein